MSDQAEKEMKIPPYTLEMYRDSLKHMMAQATGGCGNHGCVIQRPTGQGTNGGCTCSPRRIARTLRDIADAVERGGNSWQRTKEAIRGKEGKHVTREECPCCGHVGDGWEECPRDEAEEYRCHFGGKEWSIWIPMGTHGWLNKYPKRFRRRVKPELDVDQMIEEENRCCLNKSCKDYAPEFSNSCRAELSNGDPASSVCEGMRNNNAALDVRNIKTVKDIVANYLIQNGYDGLHRYDECGCDIHNLLCCDDACDGCTPGYKVESEEHGWVICAEKR